ncbi:hypothetical protein ABK040_014787 [Willaertia magna]
MKSNHRQKITPNNVVGLEKESIRKQYQAKQQWIEKYGDYFGHKVDEDILSSGRESILRTMSSSNNNTRRLYEEVKLSDDEEEDEDLSDPKMFNGVTARFLGYYTPSDSKTDDNFHSTTSLSHPPKDIELDNKDNFRKKHWLKGYFEEAAKVKNVIKTTGGEKENRPTPGKKK